MSGNLQFRRGLKSALPTSALSGMPLWCTDTKELFIGTGSGVEKIGKSEDADNSISNGQDDQGNVISTTYEKILKPITTLNSYGDINLADNSINRISIIGSVTFVLPEITDNAVFHQILIQLYMKSAMVINLGTTKFFNEKIPDLSTAGYYNIIYEHDGTNWICGVLTKG